MNDNELEAFVKIADENGEISKNDIIIQVDKWILMTYTGIAREKVVKKSCDEISQNQAQPDFPSKYSNIKISISRYLMTIYLIS